MTSSGRSALPPKYNPDLVERAVIEEVLGRHPERFTVDELSMRIVGDPEDSLEVEIASEAIRSLRAAGLVCYRDDDRLIAPTAAVARYAELMGLA